jgi:hypothetical protein
MYRLPCTVCLVYQCLREHACIIYMYIYIYIYIYIYTIYIYTHTHTYIYSIQDEQAMVFVDFALHFMLSA